MSSGAIHGFPSASFLASGSISKGMAVKLSANNTVAIATAVSDVVVGIALDTPETGQEHISIATGGFALGLLGGSVSRGDELTVNNAGKLVAVSADTDKVCAIAMQAGSANELVEVRVLTSSYRGSAGVKIATVVIPTASVLTLNTTPYELVPAPGAGVYNVVEWIVASIDYAGAAYATNTTMEFRYTNGSGTKVTADITALLDATADKAVKVGGIEAALVLTANAAIVAVAASGNPATGTSNVKVTVAYRTVALAE